MKLRRIVIAAGAAAALIVAAGVVVSFLPTKSGHSVAQSVFGGSEPKPTDIRAAGASATAAPAHGSTPSAAKPAKAKKQDNSLITGPGGSSESIPTATPTPYRLHPTAAPSSLSASDVSLAPNSKVSSKSISTAQGATQVLIEATTSTKPADTVAFYQRSLTALGMTGKSVPAVAGSTAIAFHKGTSTVTLTVSAHNKGSSYLIHGVLRTGA